jgi:hypothetical protein
MSVVCSGQMSEAAAMTKAFIARLVTRAAYGKYGDHLLAAPAGLAALRTLAHTSSRGRTGVAQAFAYVKTLADPADNAGTLGSNNQ